MLRIPGGQCVPVRKLEIVVAETGSHRTSGETEGGAVPNGRCEPAARFNHVLEAFPLFDIGAQDFQGQPAIRLDDMQIQGASGMEVPHLVGLDSVECREFIAGQQIEDGRRERSGPAEASGKMLTGDPFPGEVGADVVAALRMLCEMQFIDPIA